MTSWTPPWVWGVSFLMTISPANVANEVGNVSNGFAVEQALDVAFNLRFRGFLGGVSPAAAEEGA